MFALTFKDGTQLKVNGLTCLEKVNEYVRSYGQIIKMERV